MYMGLNGLESFCSNTDLSRSQIYRYAMRRLIFAETAGDKREIQLYCDVHIAYPCLCMSNRMVPKHTSSDRARAEEVFHDHGMEHSYQKNKADFEGETFMGMLPMD